MRNPIYVGWGVTPNVVNTEQNLVPGLHASSNGTKVGNADPNTNTILITINDSPTTDPNNYRLIRSGPTSYAKVTSEPSMKSMNFRTLITSAVNRVDVVILFESIRAISERFVNMVYGFFLGKQVAYHVVANYVRNTWGKYGLVKCMLNSSTGLFFFQFSSIDGLDSMLENGPLFIHRRVSWGRSSYARAMIELRADVELKDTIVLAMPKLDECPQNIGSDVAKNLKNPSQAPRGVLISPK
ncbi:zinc finger, CCHC-type containing protein, partial [Tanacetum coccineum]